jgi:hypothetical protein
MNSRGMINKIHVSFDEKSVQSVQNMSNHLFHLPDWWVGSKSTDVSEYAYVSLDYYRVCTQLWFQSCHPHDSLLTL